MMEFNSETGSEAQTSKRGKTLSIDLRSDLKTLITHILEDIDCDSLSNTQKLKLLDIALNHTLPSLSTEKQIAELKEEDMPMVQLHTFLMRIEASSPNSWALLASLQAPIMSPK